MKLSTSLLAVVLFSSLTGTALAQPGYGPPPGQPGYGPPPPAYYPPPPPPGRSGLAIGFGFGLGGMEADSGPIRCDRCNYDPVAGGFDFHIGAMLQPNLALLFELNATGQRLDAVGAEYLNQIQLMAALQYWITPMLWIKGGVGSSHLSISYDDGYGGDTADLDSGLGLMGAIGYEILHSSRFAIDLQLRLSSGTYGGLEDEIHAGILGVGFNWY
jgi:hypothetical protein